MKKITFLILLTLSLSNPFKELDKSFLYENQAPPTNQNNTIINISSIHVPLAIEGTSIYGASKAAIEQFSKVLARETFQYGITVNTISLSVVKDTGM